MAFSDPLPLLELGAVAVAAGALAVVAVLAQIHGVDGHHQRAETWAAEGDGSVGLAEHATRHPFRP